MAPHHTTPHLQNHHAPIVAVPTSGGETDAAAEDVLAGDGVGRPSRFHTGRFCRPREKGQNERQSRRRTQQTPDRLGKLVAEDRHGQLPVGLVRDRTRDRGQRTERLSETDLSAQRSCRRGRRRAGGRKAPAGQGRRHGLRRGIHPGLLHVLRGDAAGDGIRRGHRHGDFRAPPHQGKRSGIPGIAGARRLVHPRAGLLPPGRRDALPEDHEGRVPRWLPDVQDQQRLRVEGRRREGGQDRRGPPHREGRGDPPVRVVLDMGPALRAELVDHARGRQGHLLSDESLRGSSPQPGRPVVFLWRERRGNPHRPIDEEPQLDSQVLRRRGLEGAQRQANNLQRFDDGRATGHRNLSEGARQRVGRNRHQDDGRGPGIPQLPVLLRKTRQQQDHQQAGRLGTGQGNHQQPRCPADETLCRLGVLQPENKAGLQLGRKPQPRRPPVGPGPGPAQLLQVETVPELEETVSRPEGSTRKEVTSNNTTKTIEPNNQTAPAS
mmetsp:Transcript_115922/g.237003  ORF Transcript_115922/g.237003 Transcript_115922/m.237003 type:complete len:493 (+) Transcript_115922:281-1759(+)